jgi:hypothetical protein
VTGKWLRPPYDLDGWRVDVANMTGRHGADDLNADVARALRSMIAGRGRGRDGLLLAEHCHDAAADLAGDGWQGAMNYAGFTQPGNRPGDPKLIDMPAHRRRWPRLARPKARSAGPAPPTVKWWKTRD